MSLALLLEKYDVSTEEGLQKALSEIDKEEQEVDEALSGALSRACGLEGRLRSASQAFARLGEVRSDAQTAADMVDKTAVLARDVSAKVRQLDLARSRVAECQRRVHDLIDLQLCSAGVEAAIKAHDYETGAGLVARFLSMDPKSVAAARARGAPDPRAAMTRAAHTLREHLVTKFEEAARKEDEASVQRLFKLFPQIGRAEEGVDLLAKYLANQCEAAVRRACAVASTRSEEAVFADALTRVVEAGGAAVESARVSAAACAPALLPRAVALIQPKVCAGARRVYNEMRTARRLESGERRTLSPLAAEPTLAELALAHSRLKLYFAFLRRKTEADAASLNEEGKRAALAAIEKIIAECDLTRTAQDLLGHYLSLERYFLEESVNKALKLAAPQSGATSSSLVDDIFFIARKVIRRSLSTGSVDGACAVLNDAAALLERSAAGALRRGLRAPPPDPLPLPAPPAPGGAAGRGDALDAVGALAQRLNRDVDAQRMLFIDKRDEIAAAGERVIALYGGNPNTHNLDELRYQQFARAARLPPTADTRLSSISLLADIPSVRDKIASASSEVPGALASILGIIDTYHQAHLNEAECGARWAERLAAEACADAEPLFRAPSDREKFQSCASGLGAAAAAFRAAQELGVAGIQAALKPRIVAWAEFVADPGLGDEEMEEDADLLPNALDVLGESARSQLSARAGDELLAALAGELAARAQARLLHHRYHRESGLLVERRARRLAAWAGCNAAPARERCARLTQAAALLALERPRHAALALRPAARLAPPDVRALLARRTDFKMEEIKRLKL